MDKKQRHELLIEVQKKLKFLKINVNQFNDESLVEFDENLNEVIEQLIKNVVPKS